MWTLPEKGGDCLLLRFLRWTETSDFLFLIQGHPLCFRALWVGWRRTSAFALEHLVIAFEILFPYGRAWKTWPLHHFPLYLVSFHLKFKSSGSWPHMVIWQSNHMGVICFVCFIFGATPSNAEDVPLALQSRITPGSVWETIQNARDRTWDGCLQGIASSVQLLQPPWLYFKSSWVWIILTCHEWLMVNSNISHSWFVSASF